jgi:hypothetical protein
MLQPLDAIGEDLQNDLATLAQARVYFNHQSVGFNLLTGIERLGTVPMTAVSLDTPGGFSRRGILHTTLGTNGDPASKVDGFQRALAIMTAPPDVALMKFCFVDFDERTDIERLFARYQRALDELAAKYPLTRFMHATVPLVIRKPAWKLIVKDLLGRYDDFDLNEQREKLSALIRRTYPEDRVFDIAKLEATRPDGSSESFDRSGKRVPALVATYSDDGVHLGSLGQEMLAKAFVRQVAGVLAGPPESPARRSRASSPSSPCLSRPEREDHVQQRRPQD